MKGSGKRGSKPKLRVLVGDQALTLTDRQSNTACEIDALAAGAAKAQRVSLAKERELVADLVGTAEQRMVMAGLADTVAQAKVRGEQVESGKAGGPLLVRSRDSLTELFTRGSIGGDLYLAGCAYRALYEACHRGPPSQLRDRLGGGQGEAWAQTRAELEAKRTHVEDVVRVAARAVPLDPALAVTVLRLVAGEGAPLNPPGLGGRPKTRRAEALRVALTATGVVLKVTGSVRAPTRAQAFETNGQDCAYARAPDTTQADD